MEEKVCEFHKSGSICKCFLALLSWLDFLYMGLPESQIFLANYGKKGNSQNFSSVNDSRYTVSLQSMVN